MEPALPIEYATPVPQGRRPLTALRILLLVLGFGWFGLMTFFAIVFFVFRGFADEPGALMTAPRALLVSARTVAIGLPGLALAVAALRFKR